MSLLPTPLSSVLNTAAPVWLKQVRWCLCAGRTPSRLSDYSEEMMAWMPTCASWASLHAAYRSHCGQTCTASLVSSPPLFYSNLTHLLDASSPAPKPFCSCWILSPEFSFSQISSILTSSHPVSVCSNRTFLQTPSLITLLKSSSQLLSYPHADMVLFPTGIVFGMYLLMSRLFLLVYKFHERGAKIVSLGKINTLMPSVNGVGRPKPPAWLSLQPVLSVKSSSRLEQK